MAKQTKHLIDLADIKTLTLQCKCGSNITYAFSVPGRLPVICHSCGKDWLPTNSPIDLTQVVDGFIQSKHALERALEYPGIGFTLNLEVDLGECAKNQVDGA
jgi:hypothetical protein